MLCRRFFLALTFVGCLAPTVHGQEKSIIVASTTSTQDSGLFDHILPLFKAKTGIDVKVVAQGTGQAIDMGAAATPTWFSCTPNRRRRNLSPRASA